MNSIIHFDIACEDVQRAKKFYEGLFGWKITKAPGPMEYFMIETEGVGGGMGKRQAPWQKMQNFIQVPDIDEYMKKVQALGGKMLSPKLTVLGIGYIVSCEDTEGNAFGLLQTDENAK